MSFEDGGVHVYNDTHRAFLQALTSRSVLTFETAKPILAAILTAADRDGRVTLPGDITEDLFQAYIETTNERLSPFDLEIRTTRSQWDRTQIYALINQASDDLTKIATTLTPDEIAFAKRLLDAMFETNNTRKAETMAVSVTQGLQLAKPSRQSLGGEQTQGSAAQGITMAQAEKVINSMVAQGWFEKSNKNWVSLSPRALMELRSWLVKAYNVEEEGEDGDVVEERIKFCEACREIVTVGQRCSNYDCNCRLHNICTQQFFRNQSSRKCPKCKADWTGNDHVGENAVRQSNGTRRSAGAGSSRRRIHDHTDEDDNE